MSADGVLIESLTGTLSSDSTVRDAATAELMELSNSEGFLPAVLQLASREDVSMDVRLTATVFAKNLVNRSWFPPYASDENQFQIPEPDRITARESIVQLIVMAPAKLRRPMREVLRRMIDTPFDVVRRRRNGQEDYQLEFLRMWPSNFVQSVHECLAHSDIDTINGGLTVMYQVAQTYKWQRELKDRLIFDDEFLRPALPRLLEVCDMCLENGSPEYLEVCKNIVKLYYQTIEMNMPACLCETPESIDGWMQLLAKVISVQVETEAEEDEDISTWSSRPVWRLKKWASRCIRQLTERYGILANVEKEYKEFASFFSEQYSLQLLELMASVLNDSHTGNKYLAPPVATQILRFLGISMEAKITWSVMKPHVPTLLENTLYPYLCLTEADMELWDDDPAEYIRRKFEMTDDTFGPENESGNVLIAMLEHRPPTRKTVFDFITSALQNYEASPETERNPCVKDGVLNMLTLSLPWMTNSKKYKPLLGSLLTDSVLPELDSEHGFLRARACQVVKMISAVNFGNDVDFVVSLAHRMVDGMSDAALPVRVQAATALNYLISNQSVALDECKQHATKITESLIQMIHESESDEMGDFLDTVLHAYPEELVPHAQVLCNVLTREFVGMIEQETEAEHRAFAAMSVIRSIHTIQEMVTAKDLRVAVHDELLPLVVHIFQEGILDFYEEAAQLLDSFSEEGFTEAGLQAFGQMYNAFKRDGIDYFVDFCPIVYNMIKFGLHADDCPDEILQAVFDMCSTVWESDSRSEDERLHAGKMLQMIAGWASPNAEECVGGAVGLAMTALHSNPTTWQDVETMRIMSANIITSALNRDPEKTLLRLGSVQVPPNSESLDTRFFALWFSWIQERRFKGLHARRLGIITLCRLLSDGGSNFPEHLQQIWPHIVPMALILFENFLDAEKVYAEDSDDEDSEDELPLESDDEELQENDDDIEEPSEAEIASTLRAIGNKVEDKEPDELDEERAYSVRHLLGYEAPTDDRSIDPFVTLSQVLEHLRSNSLPAFEAATSELTANQEQDVAKIHELAVSRAQSEDESRETDQQ